MFTHYSREQKTTRAVADILRYDITGTKNSSHIMGIEKSGLMGSGGWPVSLKATRKKGKKVAGIIGWQRGLFCELIGDSIF